MTQAARHDWQDSCQVLVVGAGPAGSAAATWLARGGADVMLLDSSDFPRDKPCGDGLTPRAIAELGALGMAPWVLGQARNWGLRAAGFGEELYLPWPGGHLPRYGGAARRTVLDAAVRQGALVAGARTRTGRAVGFDHGGGAVHAVEVTAAEGRGRIRCELLA